MIQDEMDRIYNSMPLEKIPWNIETPPDALVELIDGGKVKPCKAIDFGCGAGNYAIYLAGRGFDITAIDISQAAIKIARENAKKKGADDELRDLFKPYFEIKELKVIEVSGKFISHLANYAFMERK